LATGRARGRERREKRVERRTWFSFLFSCAFAGVPAVYTSVVILKCIDETLLGAESIKTRKKKDEREKKEKREFSSLSSCTVVLKCKQCCPALKLNAFSSTREEMLSHRTSSSGKDKGSDHAMNPVVTHPWTRLQTPVVVMESRGARIM
jgi:hypothetical protein